MAISASIAVNEVYPRVCGGTTQWKGVDRRICGLSPRVRGNHLLTPYTGKYHRSIPACAGEPEPSLCSIIALTVYPRVCGGTWYTDGQQVAGVGLSPRVRGNPLAGVGCKPRLGVYPRVCGGTPAEVSAGLSIQGLSPRVRGNRHMGVERVTHRGSIPACAGEPMRRCRETCPLAVYPRVCGGTTIASQTQIAEMGLSPRVRGNPLRLLSLLHLL